MKLLLLVVACLVLFANSHVCVFAQSERKLSSKIATKLDEYGQVGGCDQTARLDYLAHFLDITPGANGYIFAALVQA